MLGGLDDAVAAHNPSERRKGKTIIRVRANSSGQQPVLSSSWLAACTCAVRADPAAGSVAAADITK